MRESFEFDKFVIAIAIAIFTIIMSSNFGNLFYTPQRAPLKKGFIVEVTESSSDAPSQPQGLPDTLDMMQVMAKVDIEAGKQVFNKCAVCHTINKGDANKIGPNLWNIVGSAAAHHKDFAYSSAMKKHGDDGNTWGFEELYRYLYSPKQYVAGTKMAFAGIKKDTDRANLIAYLRTMADTPLPLPTVGS